MSNQSAKQASIRAVTSTTGTYEEDWHSLFDLHSIDTGTFNERLLLWINAKLAASHTNLIDAQQALASANSVSNWDSMGTFDATAP